MADAQLSTLGSPIRTALGIHQDTSYSHGGEGPAQTLSPMAFGAIGDGDSHPLSERFASLAAAQAVYPHAEALTDEIDWCAWQALAEYAYQRSVAIDVTKNWSSVSALVNGQFVVNRTITFNVLNVKLIGTTPGQRVDKEYSSSFTYNGADGTIDAPVWIVDFWIFDENNDPPSGKVGNTTMSGGVRVQIDGVLFFGKNGSMTGGVGDESGFVSGIRLRKASLAHITQCIFGGCLWDAINVTDAQLFLTIDFCFFHGVYRDCISIHKGGSTFSTTCWVNYNEFGYAGRYAVWADFRGSIDADFRMYNNSLEIGGLDYFLTDNDWWVNGVVTPCAILEGGNSILEGNRYETGTGTNDYYWADIHFIGGQNQRVVGGPCRHIFMSALKQSAPENAALVAFETANGYRDITNTRNYNCGDTGDSRGGVQDLHVEGVYLLTMVLTTATGWGTSGRHTFRDVDLHLMEVEVQAGTYADQIPARLDTSPLYRSALYAQFENCNLRSTSGVMRIINGEINNCSVVLFGDETFTAATWQATTAVAANNLDNINSLVRPTTANGYVYIATTAGTTGGTEPTWPTTLGNTVVDGTVTWTCAAAAAYTSDVGSSGRYITIDNAKKIWRSTAAPTDGRHERGEVVYNTAPSAGGSLGWVCTTAGTPGTWKTFGAISA